MSDIEYLRNTEAREGVSVIADGGFTCMNEGDVKTIKKGSDDYLYIECSDGRHDLDGQLEGHQYIGLLPALKGIPA